MFDFFHPLVVHFPIVFLFLGVLASVLALLVMKKQLTWVGCAFYVFGALGIFLAVKTGHREADAFMLKYPAAESALETHEGWGEWTLWVAIVAVVMSVISLAMRKRKKPFLALRIITALVALVLAYSVYQTGHSGGYLVYHHGMKLVPAKTMRQAPIYHSNCGVGLHAGNIGVVFGYGMVDILNIARDVAHVFWYFVHCCGLFFNRHRDISRKFVYVIKNINNVVHSTHGNVCFSLTV